VTCPEIRALLEPYVDRELGPEEVASVRHHLETCGDCAERLKQLDTLGGLIRRAPYYPAPDRLRERLSRSSRRSTSRQSRLAWVAAVTVAASLVGSVWFVETMRKAQLRESDLLAETVVSSHVRSLMDEHLLDVRSSDQHTVKPWFLGKVDFSPPVIDLAASGFALGGGRLEYIAGHPAAALVYARRQHTINLFIWPEAGSSVERAPAGSSSEHAQARSIRGFHVRHWTGGGMTFWAVSDLNEAELDQFVREIRTKGGG
jgi:anti-sigma factor RsiW